MSSILIVRKLLEKIECVTASMGITSIIILAPIVQSLEMSAEMDFESSPLIQLFLKCGFQESGGETEVGHILGNENSLETVSMMLQYKKNLNNQLAHELPLNLLDDTSTEIVSEVSTEPTMQNLMESLFVCLQKEYGEK
mmetsp:Transcript_26736/g.38213  ORF Transcript_26736/g.38213 Transcript_26736/m.38213 type:complete len:139 (-) Transcript_26736:15-431(-)